MRLFRSPLVLQHVLILCMFSRGDGDGYSHNAMLVQSITLNMYGYYESSRLLATHRWRKVRRARPLDAMPFPFPLL